MFIPPLSPGHDCWELDPRQIWVLELTGVSQSPGLRIFNLPTWRTFFRLPLSSTIPNPRIFTLTSLKSERRALNDFWAEQILIQILFWNLRVLESGKQIGEIEGVISTFSLSFINAMSCSAWSPTSLNFSWGKISDTPTLTWKLNLNKFLVGFGIPKGSHILGWLVGWLLEQLITPVGSCSLLF